MKALLTLARAGTKLSSVRVLEYWPYRTGRLTAESERLDTWHNPRAKYTRTYVASQILQNLAAAITGKRPDNHTYGVFSYKGKVFTVFWSDNNTYVSMGHNVAPGTDYRLGVPYKPVQP